MCGEGLETQIRSFEIDSGPDAVAEAHRLLDLLAARVAVADSELDEGQGWDLDHASGLQAWLRARARMSHRGAAAAAKIAKHLRHLPALRAAWMEGRVSSGQVEIIVANLNDKRVGLFAERETELVPNLQRLAVGDLRTVMGEWASRADALIDPRPPAEHDSEASFIRTLDDRGELRASLAADDAVTVETALDLATSRDAEGESRTPKQRRADALIDIMRHYLDNREQTPAGRHRPHVNVMVTLEQLQGEQPGGTSIDGWLIDTPDLATWICDSTLRRVLQAQDSTLDFGRAVRSVPANLYNAVAVRDRHCRWPGCDRRARHCDAHHVVFWSHGGPTAIDNLVLLCRRHHRRLHHPGYRAKLEPDGTLTITLPDHRTITGHPPRAGPTLF